MARMARKALADMRAMEEQTERMNPVGAGATPSMGLSQIRGGRKHKKAEANEDAKSQGKALMEHLHNLHGSGYARDFHAGMSMAGGLGTGRYEGEGAGAGTGAGEEMKGGFWGALASLAVPLISNLFGKGQMTQEAHDKLMAKLGKSKSKRKVGLEGGFWGALASLAAPLIGSLFGKGQMTKEAHDELMEKLVKKPMLGKDGHGTRKMKGAGRVVGAGAGAGPFSPMALKMLGAGEAESESDGEMEGAGIISDLNIPIVSNLAGMFGLGKEKKAKRVVGAGDGRRKRAEIVKKVMREKKMSMIDASKFVKEHNLY